MEGVCRLFVDTEEVVDVVERAFGNRSRFIVKLVIRDLFVLE